MRTPAVVEDEEPLIDTTEALPLRSKRTERRQKKRKASKQSATLSDLPSELLLNLLTWLRPSDIFVLSRVSKSIRSFITREETVIARRIVGRRYAVLSRCFLLPVLLERLDEEAHVALRDPERLDQQLHIHKKPYQHVRSPDPSIVCTCLTCMLAWNNLCLVVDFAYWQKNLDAGEPIPLIDRGKFPAWNTSLISANADVVSRALYSGLWYAAILQCHLNTTVRAIERHRNNKGNKRRRFRMSEADVDAENDCFLERSGPPTLDFPFHRDAYYMLESYMPNRGWNSEDGEWKYMPASQHDRDVSFVKLWAERRKEAAKKEELEKLQEEQKLSGMARISEEHIQAEENQGGNVSIFG